MRFFIATFIAAMLPCFALGADDLSAAIKRKMDYLSQSQSVISKNLANANTPGYKAMELQSPNRKSGGGSSLRTTSPMHIGGMKNSGSFKLTRQKNAYETAPNGNNVSIEEQMVKMSENSMQYQASANLLRKMHRLVTVATGER